MLPHLVWLREVDFVPLTYAGDVYTHLTRAQNVQLVLGYVGHNVALLALPVALAALALALAEPGELCSRRRCSRAHGRAAPNPRREPVAGAQCLDHPGRGRDRPGARRRWPSRST